jgi:hypothetical protein
MHSLIHVFYSNALSDLRQSELRVNKPDKRHRRRR